MSDSEEFGPSKAKKVKISDSSSNSVPEDLLEIYKDIDTISVSELIEMSESESETGSNDGDESVKPNDVNVDKEEIKWTDELQDDAFETYNFKNQTGCFKFGNTSKVFGEPATYVRYLISVDFLCEVIKHTNNYAKWLKDKKQSNENSIEWAELKLSEFKVFIGLLLHMGHIQIPHISDYWNKDPLFNVTCFSSHMSMNRFLMILKCLQFTPHLDGTYVSEISKLNGLLEHFNNIMSMFYKGAKELTIDVPVTLHKGRIVMNHDPKSKGGKHGIKLFTLCDSNGIAIKCRFFAEERGKGKPPVEDIVMDLLSDHLFLGHTLYLVEYYTTLKLAILLREGGTYCTGMLRQDRIPKGFNVPVLNQGQLVSKYTRGVAVCKWKDRRHTHYITSQADNRSVSFKNKGKVKNKPIALEDYDIMFNSRKGGGDIFRYYPCEKLQLRCYKKFAIHIIQLMVLNAYRLYSLNCNNKQTLIDFRLCAVRDFLSSKKDIITRFLGEVGHLPARHPVNDRGKTMRKRCKLCCNQGSRKDTIYFCSECPDKPPLCLHPCFARFHHSDLLNVNS